MTLVKPEGSRLELPDFMRMKEFYIKNPSQVPCFAALVPRKLKQLLERFMRENVEITLEFEV